MCRAGHNAPFDGYLIACTMQYYILYQLLLRMLYIEVFHFRNNDKHWLTSKAAPYIGYQRCHGTSSGTRATSDHNRCI